LISGSPKTITVYSEEERVERESPDAWDEKKGETKEDNLRIQPYHPYLLLIKV